MAFALFWMLRGSFAALEILIHLFRFEQVNVTHSVTFNKKVRLGANPKKPALFEPQTEIIPHRHLSMISAKAKCRPNYFIASR